MEQFPQYIMPDRQSGIFFVQNTFGLKNTGNSSECRRCGNQKNGCISGHGTGDDGNSSGNLQSPQKSAPQIGTGKRKFGGVESRNGKQHNISTDFYHGFCAGQERRVQKKEEAGCADGLGNALSDSSGRYWCLARNPMGRIGRYRAAKSFHEAAFAESPKTALI